MTSNTLLNQAFKNQFALVLQILRVSLGKDNDLSDFLGKWGNDLSANDSFTQENFTDFLTEFKKYHSENQNRFESDVKNTLDLLFKNFDEGFDKVKDSYFELIEIDEIVKDDMDLISPSGSTHVEIKQSSVVTSGNDFSSINAGPFESSCWTDLTEESSPLIPLGKATMTIFACGTGSTEDDFNNHQYFMGENVSTVYRSVLGEEYYDKLIVNGPGTDGKDIQDFWVPYGLLKNQQPYQKLLGMLFGFGVQERVDHMKAVITNKPILPCNQLSKKAQEMHEALRARKEVKRLVCTGWSRGADALIRLANALYEDLDTKDIEVTLILLDPVPGFGRVDCSDYKLPPNVKVCYTFLAKDERSFGFSPIIPDYDPDYTQLYLFPISGGHSHLAGRNTNNLYQESAEASLSEVGIVTRFFMQLFLMRHGVKLDFDNKRHLLNLHLSDIVEYFNKIQENARAYQQSAQEEPYTIPQRSGEGRKVIPGRSYFNYALDEINIETIDLHELLKETTDAATTMVSQLSAVFYSASMAEESELSISFKSFNSMLKERYSKHNSLENFLFSLVFSEEIQKKYDPIALQRLDKRCFTEKDVEAYINMLNNRYKNLDHVLAENQSILNYFHENNQRYQKEIEKIKEKVETLEEKIIAFDALLEQMENIKNNIYEKSFKLLRLKRDIESFDREALCNSMKSHYELIKAFCQQLERNRNSIKQAISFLDEFNTNANFSDAEKKGQENLKKASQLLLERFSSEQQKFNTFISEIENLSSKDFLKSDYSLKSIKEIVSFVSQRRRYVNQSIENKIDIFIKTDLQHLDEDNKKLLKSELKADINDNLNFWTCVKNLDKKYDYENNIHSLLSNIAIETFHRYRYKYNLIFLLQKEIVRIENSRRSCVFRFFLSHRKTEVKVTRLKECLDEIKAFKIDNSPGAFYTMAREKINGMLLDKRITQRRSIGLVKSTVTRELESFGEKQRCCI